MAETPSADGVQNELPPSSVREPLVIVAGGLVALFATSTVGGLR
jgi:hypothetical protein